MFGSVVAAGVPIVVGGMAVLVALAALFIAASLTPMSIFVLNLATLLGFGLGVDYALLMASRFREELERARRRPRPRTARWTRRSWRTPWRPRSRRPGARCSSAASRCCWACRGLVLFDFMVLRSVGIAGALVVAFAVAAALTLLPAGLAILGPRIDAFPVRLRRRRAEPCGTGRGRRQGAGRVRSGRTPSRWASGAASPSG